MEKNEVKTQSTDAERAKRIPRESTFSAREIPGEIANKVIAG